jgi:hypothetical protein
VSDLRSHVSYFEKRMQEHSCVERCERLLTGNEDEYIYELSRTEGRPPVRVHIVDTYEYGMADYLARPRQIRAGDFILVVSFGPELSHAVIERARADRIGMGDVRRLMGALNWSEVWKYRPPEERKP